MKFSAIIKQTAVVLTVLMVSACAKHHGSADDNEGMNSTGLGSFGFGSGGSEAGESYTTNAPHNQVYLFDYDSDRLKDKYADSLHAQAKYMVAHPGARVLIAGHTDERGSREYNIALGERRANTVADILKMDGVSRKNIRVVSYGKERPAVIGSDDAARAQNRRAELTYEATK